HLDRRRHGTAATNRTGRFPKLSLEQRQKVIALKGKATQEAIAAQFGVTARTVARIHTRLAITAIARESKEGIRCPKLRTSRPPPSPLCRAACCCASSPTCMKPPSS